ncbi:MAG: chemotaxis protein CheB [Acidimicrobiia bacterium]
MRPPPGRAPAVVAIAASAGGLAALGAGGLPEGLAVPVVVVHHLDPVTGASRADLLDRRRR